MAEEEVAEEAEDGAEATEETTDASDGGSQKKGLPKLSAGVIGILKLILQYLLVAIISIVTSVIVIQTQSGGGSTKTQQELLKTDQMTEDVFKQVPIGADWTMEEMILPTADEDAQHTIKCRIVISYDRENPKLLEELTQRKTQIHSEVRAVIGSKKFNELNTVSKQKKLAGAIQQRIKRIVRQSGIYAVYLKEFMVF